MKFPILLTSLALSATSALAQAEKLPDLQVVAVQTIPESPVAGDKVRLRVVIKNAGDAPTSRGTVLGGEFRLNKTVIAYTDTYNLPLAPGETAVLSASGGGGAGDGTWMAREGNFTLGFVVDDVNRIHESDENNNDFVNATSFKVNAFLGPDLIVSRLTRTTSDGKSMLRVLVQNIGKGATPANVPIEVRFSLDGQTMARGQLNAPLAAGQSAEIVATTTQSMSESEGTRVLTATVDANNRFAALERRRDNNALSRTFAFNQWVQLSPTSSDAFANSIGVNTNMDSWMLSFDRIKARLLESRIRWIRTGATPDGTVFIDRLLDLGQSGIKTNLVLNANTASPQVALALARRLKPVLGSIEGQNQPDLLTPELFPEGIRKQQNAVYEALKADPQTRNIPVLSPTVDSSGDSAGALGTVSADFGAMQLVASGEMFAQSLEETIRTTRLVAPTQPLQITQAGDSTAQKDTEQPVMSERAQAKYLPRQLFEAWNHGVVRTFFSESALGFDKDDSGIIHAEGTPKPAFYALRNLISLFSDARPIAQPNPLRFSLSGETSNLRSSLLQKSDGRRFLVMWINAPSFDPDTRRDAESFSQTVSLSFDKKQRARVWRPTFSRQLVGNTRSTKTLSLDLDDELTVVELGF